MPERSKSRPASPQSDNGSARRDPMPERSLGAITANQWVMRAECAGADVNLFFPEARQSPSPQAKAFCAACPVSRECLEYAIEHRLSGVWGGTSETQRIQMRRLRRAS